MKPPFTLRCCVWVASLTALSIASVPLHAEPSFLMPDPIGWHTNHATHLGPTGPTTLDAGQSIGPAFFSDALSSTAVARWEIEIHSYTLDLNFDVAFAFPGGTETGHVHLPFERSVFFDIGYADGPPETGVSAWTYTASARVGSPIGLSNITIDVDAIEKSPPDFFDQPGLAFYSADPDATYTPGPLDGDPDVTLTLPEPSRLAQLAAGIAGLAGGARSRRSRRA